MLRISLYLLSIVASVYSSGELFILSSPPSLKFKGNEKLDESLLKEVFSASLGHTIEKSSNWNGMYIQDPFNYPEALIHVAVEGVSSLGDSKFLGEGPRFPLHTDEDEYNIWTAVTRRMLDRHPEGNNTHVRIELSNGLPSLDSYPWVASSDLHVELSLPSGGALQVDIEEDRKCLEEIALLNAISDRIKQRGHKNEDSNQDIFWFVFTSLHAVSDLHGPDSEATAEAQKLLTESLMKLVADARSAYGEYVLVTAVTSDASHTRRSRSILGEEEMSIYMDNLTNWNQAADYDEDYPVIFNIILWFGVAFVFSLLAVAIAISSMDPGRDSIIYRMTSNRMKKDN